MENAVSEEETKFNLLLRPESLENSKVLSVVVDNNLQFKVNDLLNVKEISNITKDKNRLIEILKKFDNIKLAEDNESGNFIIDENIVVFSFINVPQKMTREEVAVKLGVDLQSGSRFYKRSLFWILVTTQSEAGDYEKKFRNVNFGDGNLKYDMINRMQLMKNINKQIQTLSYHKEAHDLKVDSGKKSENMKSNYGSNNSNNNSNNKDRTNSEAFAWRKKSGEGNINDE